MAELIDREATYEVLTSFYHHKTDIQHNALREALNKVPSAEAEPVRHGHWMLYENQNQDDVNNGNYLYVCSNCKHSDIHARTVDVPYCWHCGALMDEVAQ